MKKTQHEVDVLTDGTIKQLEDSCRYYRLQLQRNQRHYKIPEGVRSSIVKLARQLIQLDEETKENEKQASQPAYTPFVDGNRD